MKIKHIITTLTFSLSINITAQSPATGTINGHDYVDLGLSVKWATCNIGADKPEDYGDYYAWGEAETNPTFTLNSLFFLLYKRLRLTPAVPVYYRFSL